MKIKSIILLPLILVIIACVARQQEKQTIVTKSKSLNQVLTQLRLGNNQLILETRLWRDFMPTIGESSNSPLLSSIKLIDKNKTPLPKHLILKKHYIIQGDKIWEYTFEDIHKSAPYKQIGISRNGPELEAGSEVDIVCEFEFDGKLYQIAAKSQEIVATH